MRQYPHHSEPYSLVLLGSLSFTLKTQGNSQRIGIRAVEEAWFWAERITRTAEYWGVMREAGRRVKDPILQVLREECLLSW